MSKVKFCFTTIFTLILLGMFAAIASAAGNQTIDNFTPTPGNPAPNIYVGTVDNNGNTNQHKTHGDFQNNTNSCANCHSAHNGEDATLLKFQDTESNLCMACHDGSLGFYNVNKNSGAGVFNSSHDSASMHNVGTQTIGSAPGAYSNKSTEALQCSSCHNPHGSVNDRLLNESVLNGVLYAGLEKGTKAINLSLTPDPAFAEINKSTTNSGLLITTSIGPKDNSDKVNYNKFCTACHDDYLNSSGAPNRTAHYSHTTNSASAGRNCAACHYAHGTDITLLKDTQGKTIADLMKPTTQGGKGWDLEKAEAYMEDVNPGGSKLKKYTNMVVCYTCHTSSHSIDTQMPTQNGDPTLGTGEYWNWTYSSYEKKNVPTFNGKAGIR
jgi:predicted CXXCH cytochrome family protein